MIKILILVFKVFVALFLLYWLVYWLVGGFKLNSLEKEYRECSTESEYMDLHGKIDSFGNTHSTWMHRLFLERRIVHIISNSLRRGWPQKTTQG